MLTVESGESVGVRVNARPQMTMREVLEFDGPIMRTPHTERLHMAEHSMSRVGVVQLYDRVPFDKTFIPLPALKAIPFTGVHPAYIPTEDGFSVFQRHTLPILLEDSNQLLLASDRHPHSNPRQPLEGSLSLAANNPQRHDKLTGYETFSDTALSMADILRGIVREISQAHHNPLDPLHQDARQINTVDIVDRWIDTQGNYHRLPEDTPIEALPELIEQAIEYSAQLARHARSVKPETLEGVEGPIFNNRTNASIGFISEFVRNPVNDQILSLSGDAMLRYMTKPELKYPEHIERMFRFAQRLRIGIPSEVTVHMTRSSGAKFWVASSAESADVEKLFSLLTDILVQSSLVVEEDGRFLIGVEGARSIDDAQKDQKTRKMMLALSQTRNIQKIARGFSEVSGGLADPFYTLDTEHRLDQSNLDHSADLTTSPVFMDMPLEDATLLTETIATLMKKQKFIN